MSTIKKVYLGDSGTKLLIDCQTDISAAISLSIRVRKPGGQMVDWPGTLEASNTMFYITLPDDLDQSGVWKLQAVVTFADGRWYGATADLIVFGPFL